MTVITHGAGDPARPVGRMGPAGRAARVRAVDMSVFSMICVGNPHYLRAGNPDHEKPGRATAKAASHPLGPGLRPAVAAAPGWRPSAG